MPSEERFGKVCSEQVETECHFIMQNKTIKIIRATLSLPSRTWFEQTFIQTYSHTQEIMLYSTGFDKKL